VRHKLAALKRIALLKMRDAYFPIDRLDPYIFDEACLTHADVDAMVQKHWAQGHPAREIYIEIATYLSNSGHHTHANPLYRKALQSDQPMLGPILRKIFEKEIDPAAPKPATTEQSHSVYLQNLLLSEESTCESLLKAHQDYDRRYFGHIDPVPRPAKGPNTKIKVGYLCHFFYDGVSPGCLMPMLHNHDLERFEIHCYDDGVTPETARHPSHHWHDIRGKSDEEVAQLIAAEGIDILQELNGHCFLSRYGVLARRAAPIQINWYNHCSTTGMKNTDYIVSDRISIPDEDLPFFSEQVWRKDTFLGAINFLERQHNEPIAPPPSVKNGYVTFSCFGASHKITQKSIALWASVLKNNPTAKMIIKAGALTYPQYQNSYRKLFAAHGIDADRITLEGWSPYQDLLKRYADTDIMLDTCPVTGGTTTFESAWHGVPIITLKGQRWTARSGSSVAQVLGLSDITVASSEQDFIDKATALANNPEQLASLRATLRERMAKSSLVDMKQFTRDMERAYLDMWESKTEAKRIAA
jgi:protein O-GlcNAc transferase